MRKAIEGYEGHYEVDDSGFVFSLKSNKYLAGTKGNSDYLQIVLCKSGITKTVMVHRLIAKAFVPNPENKPEVNHKDYNKNNNHYSNLEWNTSRENNTHAMLKPNRKFVSGMKGKFGKQHNRSLTIFEFDLQGNLLAEYESGLDFQRKTGFNHSSPSWSIKFKKPIYGKYYSRSKEWLKTDEVKLRVLNS